MPARGNIQRQLDHATRNISVDRVEELRNGASPEGIQERFVVSLLEEIATMERLRHNLSIQQSV